MVSFFFFFFMVDTGKGNVVSNLFWDIKSVLVLLLFYYFFLFYFTPNHKDWAESVEQLLVHIHTHMENFQQTHKVMYDVVFAINPAVIQAFCPSHHVQTTCIPYLSICITSCFLNTVSSMNISHCVADQWTCANICAASVVERVSLAIAWPC